MFRISAHIFELSFDFSFLNDEYILLKAADIDR